MWLRLVLGLGLFLGSLAIGWCLHRRAVLTPRHISALVRAVVIGCSPVILCLTFWAMDLRHLSPWLLPFLGAVISASTLIPAYAYARGAGLSSAQTGSFLNCAFFSNLGYLGAFTAFAVYGEAGYALCSLYLVFFTPCFYTLGFWIAQRCGRARQPSHLGAAFGGELRLYPFIGMAIGALLSVARVPRPTPLEWLNSLLIPISTAGYLIVIGSQLLVESPMPWVRPCLVMSGIKFLYTPLVAWALVALLRLEGLTRVVVLLQASTPVAISPLVLPLLFGLDRRLANALWVFTTALAVPWLLLILPVLQRL